uniref:RING-type domain-containing protein n=1 Tax=Amphimedon queenslandica TaxID=400682 RepID=A0A1X7USB0_AMPQE
MSQLSKEDLSFVEELPQHVDIDCPICLYILKDPHQVTCCGNNFCENCIKRCKNNSYQSFPDKKCLRVINGLAVKCSNQKKGCQWKGSLKDLFIHLNEGEKEGECQYEEIKCRYDKCRRIFL